MFPGSHGIELQTDLGEQLGTQNAGEEMFKLGSLGDQTAVITGGGRGPRRMALAEAGAAVHLIGRRLNKLELVAAKAREFGVNASVQSVDISTSLGAGPSGTARQG